MSGDGVALAARRRALVDLPWTWLHQVHGADVVTVSSSGEHAGAVADGAVTAISGAVLAVHAADCAPIALVSPEGVVGVAHGGWRGLVAGIVERTVAAMGELGARRIDAVLGPCIRPACYPFGAEELDRVAAVLGDGVRGRTAAGGDALDVPAAVHAALGRAGVRQSRDLDRCTACRAELFSHRAGGDAGRQAVLAWLT